MRIDSAMFKEVAFLQREVSRDIHLNPPVSSDIIITEGGKNFTTAVDRAVEARMRDELRQRWPQIGFLGEESDEVTDGRYIWILDPTDGTSIYAQGGEYYSMSLALADRETGTVPFGTLYQPTANRQFVRASHESPRVMVCDSDHSDGEIRLFDSVDRTVRPSPSACPGEWLVCAFGTSKHYDKIPGIKEKLANVFEKEKYAAFEDRKWGVIDARPCAGSSALFMADIADGKRHAAVTFFQAAWDMAVGALLARDAGCIVHCGTDVNTWTGGDLEAQIARCDKKTLINVSVFANKHVQEYVERKTGLRY